LSTLIETLKGRAKVTLLQMPPSAVWQWIALFGGLVGLAISILAIPAALQMFFGRPSPRLAFETVSSATHVALQCHITNKPVQSRVLKALGITRQSTTITAALRFMEQGTNKELVVDMLPLSQGLGGPSQDVADLTAVWPLVVAPIAWVRSDTSASVQSKSKTKQISEGTYIAKIDIRTEHGQRISVSKTVYVGSNPDGLHWGS
jgi:hypothetical protein